MDVATGLGSLQREEIACDHDDDKIGFDDVSTIQSDSDLDPSLPTENRAI